MAFYFFCVLLGLGIIWLFIKIIKSISFEIFLFLVVLLGIIVLIGVVLFSGFTLAFLMPFLPIIGAIAALGIVFCIIKAIFSHF